jgi:hypothetical protein
MRSKLCLFMRSNLSNNIDQEVDTSIMRSKFQKALLGGRSADSCGGWSYVSHSVFEKSDFNLFGGFILCESR